MMRLKKISFIVLFSWKKVYLCRTDLQLIY